MDTEYSMDQVFIKKVADIIEINLGNEQFSVRELARELGISRSNLHRKLQMIKGKSASRFIREYRLEKAMDMLKKDVATASEIGFSVGFGSPSYFNKCFHKYYGYPPGEAKFRGIKPSHQEENSIPIIKTDKSQKNFQFLRIALVVIVAIISVLAVSYVIYSNSNNLISKKTKFIIRDKSIAVLPCINLSGEKENQYFADGQMEAVLNHLTRISELRVISRTTMLSYRETTKSIPEIAKELDVKYVLELSVQKSEKKIRINAQLIDADSDQHIWSSNYDKNLIDIFSIQTDIAKQIALELRVRITSSELEHLEKKPTENLEAYKFFLLGRHFWNNRTIVDYNKSIEYYEKAIDIDPEYGLAYAGLADTYNLLALQGPYEERKNNRDKAVELAFRALELNEHLAVAHNVLGSIYTYVDWNWEAAEREYLIAIKINPNYPTVHHYYSEHLSITGRHKKAREHIDKALNLDPLSFVINHVSTKLYLHQGSFKKALISNQRCSELNKDHQWTLGFDFFINYWLGNDKAVIEATIKIGQENGNFESDEVNKAYQELGLNGLCKLIIDRSKNTHTKAQLYCLIEEDEKAISVLELLYANKALGPELAFDIHFKHLYSNNRFIELLKKMNLSPSQLKS